MRRRILFGCAASLVLLACGSESIDQPNAAEPAGEVEPALLEESAPEPAGVEAVVRSPADEMWKPDGLVVHEWGTFTAVQSSTGYYLEGLHHEEEPLPAFVHEVNYDGVSEAYAVKGMSYLPEPVTQKLETPVIYFYADEPQRVAVSVDFPRGVISEWYPQSVASQSALSRGRLAKGAMDWMVDLSHEPVDLIGVREDEIWAPSRQVPDAMYVSRGLEADKFIFYRGVGRFQPPFRVINDGETFTVANTSAEPIEHVYLLEVTEHTGHIHRVGRVDAFDRVDFSPAPKEAPQPVDEMVEEAKRELSAGLVETGLTEDEARSMVETWSRSYFRTPGIRVLYTVPRAWTDELLPIRIEPEPDELVRTLVGRVELLTPQDERAAVAEVRAAYEANDTDFYLDAPIRFSEPRLRRACDMIHDREVADWCQSRAQAMMLNVMQMPF